MELFFFWKSWTREHRLIFYGIASIFVLSIIYFLYSLIIGTGAIIDWESLVQSDSVETIIDTVKQPPFSLPVSVESIIFLEYFGGSTININEGAYYILLTFLAIGLSMALTVVTYLPRFWYMVAMGIFIVLIIFFKLELLMLFNSSSKTGLIVVLLFYLPASFYFQSFNKAAPVYLRLLVFLGFTILFGILVYFFAGTGHPFMQLAVFGMPALLIVALLFIIIIAHDIVAGFLNAISSGKTGIGNWKHFFFITGVYLLNILVIYLNEVGVLNWDIIPINVFMILLISALVGIWGYKQKEPQYEYLFPFNPLGGLLYLTLGTLTFGTIGFFYATGNDPILDVVHDIIIFSQLGYGFVFVMYVATNFLSLMTRNISVRKVLYKPNVMPYFTYRFAGLIAFGALLFLENWELPVEKSFAGYYNGLGDYYKIVGDDVLANGYYLQGSQYGYSNHRSNYALASNAFINQDIPQAINHYKRSNFSWPTEYSYINLSNIYFAQNRYFDAMYQLKEGLRKFPESGPIKNNLGILYSKIDFFDSSLYYLEEAYQYSVSKNEARNNILAVLSQSKARLDEEQDWLLEPRNAINTANSYAFLNSNAQGSDPEYVGDLGDQNQFVHSAVYNYLVNTLWRSDTISFDMVEKLSGTNIFFDRRLILGEALVNYYNGDVGKALSMINGVRGGDRFWTGDVDQLMALWFFENEDFRFADQFFKSAAENYSEDGQIGLIMSNCLSGKPEKAITVIDSLVEIGNENLKRIASNVRPILKEINREIVKDWNDPQKYQWLLFNQSWENDLDYFQFEDDNYKAKSHLDYSRYLLKIDKTDKAAEVIGKTQTLSVTDSTLSSEVLSQMLHLAAKLNDLKTIASIIDIGFKPGSEADELLYNSLLLAARGDSSLSEDLYSKFTNANPYNEPLIYSASQFYASKGDMENAYSVLQWAANLNPNSIFLQKEYVRICGKMGYDRFGYYVLNIIKDRMVPEDFNSLLNGFEVDLEARTRLDF